MIADEAFLMKKTELRNCKKDQKLRMVIGREHVDELVRLLGDAQPFLCRENVEQENG